MTALIDETHDPLRASWIESANGHSEFPIQNLPFGIFSAESRAPRGGVAIGDKILDLGAAFTAGLFSGDAERAALAACGTSLNALLSMGHAPRRALRRRLSDLFRSNSDNRSIVKRFLHEASSCTLHLPVSIGGYTDFYAGIHHAMNVGRLFRPDNPLLPNYKHVPIGYHGRTSSIRPSGAVVRRPRGQYRPPDADAPVFGLSQQLDYELELGIWVGPGSELGQSVSIEHAAEHFAGMCLLNDWSARDLQAWEYQPLGPFLSKNFLTTISPWIVTAEALAAFRIAQPPRAEMDPRPLHYLWDEVDQGSGAFAIELEVFITTAKMRHAGLAPYRLSHGPITGMYWTVAQLITHHTVSGCNLNPGDLLGSGTLSTQASEGFGSLLELSEGGRRPIALPGGETRTFLEGGDEIVLSGHARSEGRVSIGLGHCVGTIDSYGPAPEVKRCST